MPDNRDVYESPEVVRSYLGARNLQPPERSILELLRAELANGRMLDVGVGAGRTTGHFSPAVREYVGIDYSSAMIRSSREKFADMSRARFLVADARSLCFATERFDFVLFSFNGLDAFGRADRERIFLEMRRVLKQGGRLCFSTHNARNLRQMYSFHFPRDPRRIPWEYRRYRKVQQINGPESNFTGKDWFIINDGGHDFRCWHVYIRPELQRQELEAMGFHDVSVFGLRDGARLPEPEWQRNTDSWLYYLCRS